MTPQDSLTEIGFFNHFTATKDYDSLTEQGYEAIMSAFDKLLPTPLVKQSLALDLGCGTGSFTRRYLTGRAHQVMGIDIAYTALKRALFHHDGATYINATLEHLPVKTASVDLIIFSGVLHHFNDPLQCLQEGYRVLAPGGYMLSYDPHRNNPCMWLYRDKQSPFCSSAGKTPNEILMDKKTFGNQLGKAGFKTIQLQAISGVGISYLESPRARAFLPLYNAFESLLGATPLADHYGSFLLSCSKK